MNDERLQTEQSETFDLTGLLDKITANCENADLVYACVKGGDVKLKHNLITEAMILDENWIVTIEEAFFSLEQIAKDPKKSIIDEQVLVNVAKARKINAKSIQYLASHTQHISSIDNDEVRPNKVMTTELAEDYCTYENRFIRSLIEKTEKFVHARYDEIRAKINVHRTDLIEYDGEINVKGAEVKYNLAISVRDVPRGSVELQNNYALLKRIEIILRRIRMIKASVFWQMTEGAKPVFPPIAKTNLITKNVDYSNAYKLWLFISAYTFEGFRMEVERKTLPFDDEYYRDLCYVAALLINTTRANHKIRRELFKAVPASWMREKKYKVLNRFVYEPSFANKDVKAGDEVVNQYYFDEMKRIIGKATSSLRGDTLIESKSVQMTFARFYHAMTRVANEIYAEVLKVTPKKVTKKKRTRIDAAKEKVALQTEIFKRARILSRMKSEELTRTLNAESKELLKLEQLKFDLAQTEEKKVNAKKRRQSRQKKLEAIKEKGVAAVEGALKERDAIIESESERQERILAERRDKINRLKEQRERRQLARLKEKYESGDV